ncbi:MAG: FHA domain-containing protein [Propionivibrio sp.]|nr:FHA domain-containing protein [Propionivibrio sp.]
MSFAKDYVTIGRSPDNDVVVIGQLVAPYHMAICRTGSRVEIRKCDPFQAFSLTDNGANRTACQSKRVPGSRSSRQTSSDR